jgi:predicted glycoside hydrolase/deacetylase ChbG (UPF0249 family)
MTRTNIKLPPSFRHWRLKAVFALFLAFALAGLESCAQAKTVILVNGDDVGISADFTDATIKAYEAGALSSVSLVACGQDADRAIAILKSKPNIPVNLHYALVGDWKPLSAGASLRGPDGNMWASSGEAAYKVRTQDAAAEFEAQLEKLLAAGIVVQCVDSHVSGYFTRDDIFSVVFELARKKGLPIVSPYYPNMPDSWKAFFPLASYEGIYALPDGAEENPANRAAAYWKLLASLGPGRHYLFSHQGLGFPDQDPAGDRLIRVDDSKFWTDPATRKRLASMGITVGDTRWLKAGFQAALKAQNER